EPCDTPSVALCNVPTPFAQPQFPAYIVNERTGSNAAVGVANIFSNPENVIDNNYENYASILVPVGVGSTSSIAVRGINQTFSGGNFAGFIIENTNLLNIDLLGNINIKTYKNNSPIETASGDTLAANLKLLSGTNK